MLIAVNYHYIRESFDDPFPSIFGVTPDRFSRELDLLGESASFLNAGDIIHIIQGRKKVPPRAVVITFDDGLREQFDLAWPILQKKGIPAIFYVNTRPIEENFVTTTHKIHMIRSRTHPDRLLSVLKELLGGQGIPLKMPDADVAAKVYKYDTQEAARLKYFLNHTLDQGQKGQVVDQCFKALGFDQIKASRGLYMDVDMICRLARSGTLGAHGHSHIPLGLLDDKTALEDFDKCADKLQEWTGKSVSSFSYPFGFYEACSRVVAGRARERGVWFAFTMERAGNRVIDEPMFMARFSNSDIFRQDQAPDLEGFWSKVRHASWFR
jgi:peptidoglycan/xylan/chitin deacetylase (PgdA/CDA1 family)